MFRQYTFNLVFSASEVEQRYYKDRLENIVVQTEQGISIQLPLRRFSPFISNIGIRGRFLLTLDQQNRFISMQKIGEI